MKARIAQLEAELKESKASDDAAKAFDQEDAASRERLHALDPLHRALAVAHYGQASVVELETVDLLHYRRQSLPIENVLHRALQSIEPRIKKIDNSASQ